MKKLCILLLAAALLALGCAVLASCGDNTPPAPPTPQSITFVQDEATEYVIVYDGSNASLKRVNTLINWLNTNLGVDRKSVVKVVDNDKEAPATDKEILVGMTDRALSQTQANYIGEETDDFRWLISTDGTRLALNANSDIAWSKLFEELATMIKGNRLSMRANYKITGLYTLEQYEADIEAAELAELEKLKAELAEKVPALKDMLDDFDLEADFGGTALTAFPTNAWNDPAVNPEEGVHPRLFFTEDDLPGMRQYLKDHDEFEADFLEQVNSNISYGVLPMATIRGNGVYNYNSGTLNKIMAKALYYQISGIEYYGYEAILSMKNFIKTLGIGYFNSDQCRYFGQTVYAAACVYDWCYDLMTEDDKLQIQVGVENKLLKGTSGCEYTYFTGEKDENGKDIYEVAYCDGSTVPYKQADGGPAPVAQANKNKMEIGFPPSHTGALFGHNSEYQLLRDYMSFALAIYDEETSWWDYVGGRFYQQYYPARQFFYSEEAAIYPEGTACYAPFRFVCDMYSAWMIYALTGEVPYGEGLHQVPYSFLEHETENKGIFATGDGGATAFGGTFGSSAMMVAYLFNDPVLYTNASYAGTGLSVAERVILHANGVEAAPAEERTKNFDVIQYNGGHYGQVIMRETWGADYDAIVLMKGAGMMNGGHDHNDFGSFQIYYKGRLTTEDGIYDTWGSEQHFYYHVGTAAHNCVLVYNDKSAPHSNYNGGQRNLMAHGRPNGRSTVEEWRDEAGFYMGVTTGLAFGYANEEKTQAKYTYYQNDLTAAYYSTAVAYYNRTMLAVYTGDEEVPMVMLVFDNIEGKSKDYQKTFLLQCVKEPVVDEENKTVTIDNGKGKLVLTSLMGGDSFAAYGRTSQGGKVDPANATGEERYYLSGINKSLFSKGGLSSSNNSDNTNAWGHVEIAAAKGNATDYLLNVMYVTDSDKNPEIETKSFTGTGCVAAQVGNVIGIFTTDQVRGNLKSTGGPTNPTVEGYTDTEISVNTTGVGKREYYVGGLAAGKWQVKIGSNVVGTYTVEEGEHMLTFEGRCGKVTITPID